MRPQCSSSSCSSSSEDVVEIVLWAERRASCILLPLHHLRPILLSFQKHFRFHFPSSSSVPPHPHQRHRNSNDASRPRNSNGRCSSRRCKRGRLRGRRDLARGTTGGCARRRGGSWPRRATGACAAGLGGGGVGGGEGGTMARPQRWTTEMRLRRRANSKVNVVSSIAVATTGVSLGGRIESVLRDSRRRHRRRRNVSRGHLRMPICFPALRVVFLLVHLPLERFA
mmetsp:Transcript_22438/g.47205  ORF Transcript_22438/g.47205 Transcript_22438/m.47205 type:complete len:226 (+) Transcript_22438:1201-1878(+)